MNRAGTYQLVSIAGLHCLLLCIALPGEGWAQLTDTTNAGQRGAPTVYKTNARASAMADATVGDPTNLAVINVNPAGLSFVQNHNSFQANISQNWNNNVLLENFTLPAFKFDNHAFAAQFAIHHDRGLESLNILGNNPMPQPKITMYQVDMVYSFTAWDVLSFGVLNNFSFAQNSIARYWTYYPVFGMMYAPSQSISYGLAFRGLGRSVVYNVVNDTGLTTLGSQDLRESLELGAALQFPVDTDNTYLSISLANEKRFGEDGIWYKAGFELKSFSYLALRAGLIFQPETEIYAPRFGLGVTSDLLTLDYAISYSKELYERYHQLGITLHLDNF